VRAGDIAVGDIYYFENVHVFKLKFNVCVAPGLFLLVNTDKKAHNVMISRSDYPFLDYDSFVHCSWPCVYEPDEEIKGALPKGRLKLATVREIIQCVQGCRILPRTQKDIIIPSLLAYLNTIKT